MMKPMGPVSLAKNISSRGTMMETAAAATGPKTKPPMQMTVSFTSSCKKV